jgi:hypothetical protein
MAHKPTSAVHCIRAPVLQIAATLPINSENIIQALFILQPELKHARTPRPSSIFQTLNRTTLFKKTQKKQKK